MGIGKKEKGALTRIKSRIDAVDAKLLGVNNTVKFDGERVNNILRWRGVNSTQGGRGYNNT